MKLEPECIGCLFNQMLKAFKILKPDISQETIINAQKKLMAYLLNIDIDNTDTPIIGKDLYKLVSETLGEEDPFRALKDEYNSLTLEYQEEIKEIIDNAEEPLLEALFIAALGNTIDFGSQHEMHLLSDLKNFSPRNLVINDYSEFKKSLERANHILILLDNAGEIVFDKILVEILQKLYPQLDIICTVRSRPIINDATMEDAKFINLTKIAKVIEAQDTPGINVSSATKEFKKIFFKEKGIILSKGQGNFESLFLMEIPNKEVYYLFKAKCNLMGRIFGVKIGDLVFKKKTSNF